MLDTLTYIGEKLNHANITWGVGASILLNQYGLINQPNDIDILVSINDIEKADEILKELGQKKKWEMSASYSTKYFYEYVINGVDVDVMAGMALNHGDGVFYYTFDSRSVTGHRIINGIDIPFTSLEDWFVIYQLIPNREHKVKLIENHLLSSGVKHLDLLERALKASLPIEVKERIERLIRTCD